MGQVSRVSRNNTTVRFDRGVISVTLHRTEVVRVADGIVTLNTGGWRTATTVSRMTQASHQYDLGYAVSRAGGTMSVRLGHHEGAKSYEFDRSIVFDSIALAVLSIDGAPYISA